MTADEQREQRVDVSPAPARFGGGPADIRLDRLVDGVRLAVIGVVATVGLSVGFGVGDGWLGVGSGLASVGVLVAAFKVRPTRNGVAWLSDWIVGR